MPAINNSFEIRMKGRWVTVPSLDIHGKTFYTTGTWMRIARVRSEEMMEDELSNPTSYIEELKGSGSKMLKADIFTFPQKLPSTELKYPYPFERESVATIHLTSFNQWWESLPQETRKNVRRSAKRGVVVRIAKFDDDLIRGIREVNDDSPMRQGMRNAYYGKDPRRPEDCTASFAAGAILSAPITARR